MEFPSSVLRMWSPVPLCDFLWQLRIYVKSLTFEKEKLLESVFACLTRISLKTKNQGIAIIFWTHQKFNVSIFTIKRLIIIWLSSRDEM